jgi:hypothetical protein
MARRDCYYHYPKDKNGKYTGHTLCMLLKDGLIYHGEALCASEDHFTKSIGRKLAYERAIEAYEASKRRSMNKVTKKVKSKVKVAHYNTSAKGYESYKLKTKLISNKTNDMRLEVWSSEKDKNWVGSYNFLNLKDDGNGVSFKFESGKELNLDYCELEALRLGLYSHNKNSWSDGKFKPKRLK